MQTKTTETVLGLIGRTPLVRVQCTMAADVEIWAKLEMFNPGGSVKDRIALQMIEAAETEGLLAPGGTIIEPTSGNTGIGLALVASVKNYRLILVMPDNMSVERRRLLEAYGAELVLTPGAEGMRGSINKAHALQETMQDAFVPQQFSNPHNPETHRQTTAQEILEQTDGRVDAFVCGVGTGGTITGVGEVLKEQNPQAKVFAVEPAQSPILSGGNPGPHRIQGIGAGFVPDVLNRSVIDDVITVDDGAAYEASLNLAKQAGLLVGISSGAALIGSQEAAKRLPRGACVVTIFPDKGERYFSMAARFS